MAKKLLKKIETNKYKKKSENKKSEKVKLEKKIDKHSKIKEVKTENQEKFAKKETKIEEEIVEQEVKNKENSILNQTVVKTEKTLYGITQPQSIVDEMRKSYLDYAMSVIVSRALPDVRDGLKPVHHPSV